MNDATQTPDARPQSTKKPKTGRGKSSKSEVDYKLEVISGALKQLPEGCKYHLTIDAPDGQMHRVTNMM